MPHESPVLPIVSGNPFWGRKNQTIWKNRVLCLIKKLWYLMSNFWCGFIIFLNMLWILKLKSIDTWINYSSNQNGNSFNVTQHFWFDKFLLPPHYSDKSSVANRPHMEPSYLWDCPTDSLWCELNSIKGKESAMYWGSMSQVILLQQHLIHAIV